MNNRRIKVDGQHGRIFVILLIQMEHVLFLSIRLIIS